MYPESQSHDHTVVSKRYSSVRSASVKTKVSLILHASTRRRVDAWTHPHNDASARQRVEASTHRHVDASTRQRRVDASTLGRAHTSSRRHAKTSRRRGSTSICAGASRLVDLTDLASRPRWRVLVAQPGLWPRNKFEGRDIANGLCTC